LTLVVKVSGRFNKTFVPRRFAQATFISLFCEIVADFYFCSYEGLEGVVPSGDNSLYLLTGLPYQVAFGIKTVLEPSRGGDVST